ncbi:MAG: hypothetical protein M1497_05835 [Nitrospirae bacterium]|nr:hypothetical protein [Nitrospirota bacterium]
MKSPECFGCITCVSSCPSEEALKMTFTARGKRRALKPYLYPLLLIVVFYLIIGAGVAAGKWRSDIPYDEYRRIIPELGQR